MAKKTLLLPYDTDGSLYWTDPPSRRYDPTTREFYPVTAEWREAAPFRARLRFHRIMTVRSGYTVRMRDEDTGATYPMKGDEFTRLIPAMVYGLLPVMTWQPYKWGSNYNIRHVAEE